MNNQIVFVNGKSKCGCTMEYTDGCGEYSDVHTITPCAAHSHQEVAEKRIAELTEFVQHVNKCLLKNGEYAPLSHELIQNVLGIRADGKGAAQ